MANRNAPRAGHVEALRGLACLLLVAYHVIGNDPQHGMHVADGSAWRFFTEIFMHLRMPLFSFISGYVFSSAVANRAELGAAFKKKLRRIGIPFVVVSSLFYLVLGYSMPREVQVPMWTIYFLPYEHYWYLQATMLIMAFVLLAAFLAGRYRPFVLATLLPVAVFVFLLDRTFDPDIFALGSALYLLPYFLLGHLLRLLSVDKGIGDDPARRRLAVFLLGAAALFLFLLDIASVSGRLPIDFARQSAAGIALGLSACLFLFFLRIRNRWLEAIGAYSYSIYLFHVFGTAAFRHVALTLWPSMPRIAFFLAALVIGIAFPIVLHRIFIRHRASALLLLGIDLKPEQRGSERQSLTVGVAQR